MAESSLTVCSIDGVSIKLPYRSKGWHRIYRDSVKRWTRAYVKVGIEKLEGSHYIRAHSEFVQLTSGAHSIELHGRDMHASNGRKHAIMSERRRGEDVAYEEWRMMVTLPLCTAGLEAVGHFPLCADGRRKKKQGPQAGWLHKTVKTRAAGKTLG